MYVPDVTARRVPTEQEPERGCATLRVGSSQIALSEGLRWVEPDGQHVIRSVEFDVNVGAETFESALSKFIMGLCDFAVYLGDLEDRAENEEEMFHRLAPRVIRVAQALERHSEARFQRATGMKKLARGRRLGEDRHEWRPLSLQPGSRRPSHA